MHLPWGPLTVTAAAALCVGAWLAERRGRPRLAIVLLGIAAMVVRLFAASDHHLHEWDERFHAVVARNLLADPLRPTLYADPVMPYDPRDWLANHVWLHKPPLALWTMSLSLLAFGQTELAVRLPSVLASSFAVLLTGTMGLHLFGARVGVRAAFLHALSGALIEIAAGRRPTDHVDTLFVVWIEVALWLALCAGAKPGPGRVAAVGVVTGLAILTKWLVAVLVPAVWAVFFLARRDVRRALMLPAAAMAVAATVAAPWNLLASRAFPLEYAFERSYDFAHLTQALEGHGGSPFFHLGRLPLVLGELGIVPVAVFLAWTFRRREAAAMAVAAWILLPYLFFAAVATKMPGYVLVAAPALFLAAAWGWTEIEQWALQARAARAARVVLVGALMILPFRMMIERVRPFRARPDPAWAHELRDLGRVLSPPCVLFGTSRYVEAMFYTRCMAYPFTPSAGDLERVRSRGYHVVIPPSPIPRSAGGPKVDTLHGDSVIFTGLSGRAGPCLAPPADKEEIEDEAWTFLSHVGRARGFGAVPAARMQPPQAGGGERHRSQVRGEPPARAPGQRGRGHLFLAARAHGQAPRR